MSEYADQLNATTNTTHLLWADHRQVLLLVVAIPLDHGGGAMSDDALAAECQAMTDDELRNAIAAIRGNPKRAGSRARRLNMAESLALAALMAEEARRVTAGGEDD